MAENNMQKMTRKFLVANLALSVLHILPANADSVTAAASNAAISLNDLTCQLPGNCVNSFESAGLAPLSFEGTAADAVALLQATLATFPEATINSTQAFYLEATFTTKMGFRDQVEFMINEAEKRIDFRSRSKFGLYDFGKNRSRMREFSTRFMKIEIDARKVE
jgi:uncharacterized protein (DUF1499 family)